MDQGSVRHFAKTSSDQRSPVVLVLGKPRPEAPVDAAAHVELPGRAGAQPRTLEATVDGAVTPDHGLPVHLGTLLENASGEPAVVVDLLTSFAADFPQLRSALHDAVTRDDPDALVRGAHALEGELLALGATTAAALARDLAGLGRSGITAGADELLADLDAEADALLGLARDTDRLTAALIRASS